MQTLKIFEPEWLENTCCIVTSGSGSLYYSLTKGSRIKMFLMAEIVTATSANSHIFSTFYNKIGAIHICYQLNHNSGSPLLSHDIVINVKKFFWYLHAIIFFCLQGYTDMVNYFVIAYFDNSK